jgi:hypothetical protein
MVLSGEDVGCSDPAGLDPLDHDRHVLAGSEDLT